MTSAIWDYCHLSSDSAMIVDQVQTHLIDESNTTGDSVAVNSSQDGNSLGNVASKKIDDLQVSLQDAEGSCRESIELLDSILEVLNDVASAYDDVTGRTNSLMSNCEKLLDQQHTLQQTVEILKKTLTPFNDIEEIAGSLGIPFEPRDFSSAGGNYAGQRAVTANLIDSSNSGSITNVDPRSKDFLDILIKLSKAVVFLRNHRDIMDCDRYLLWLQKLQTRATSLVARAMRELVDKSTKTCQELHQQKMYKKASTTAAQNARNSSRGGGGKLALLVPDDFDQQPIESAPIYQKFRGLSYRMRELALLLVVNVDFNGTGAPGAYIGNVGRQNAAAAAMVTGKFGRSRNIRSEGGNRGYVPGGGVGAAPSSSQSSSVSVIEEVKQGYALMRNELLLPFIKEQWLGILASHNANNNMATPPASSSSISPNGASNGASNSGVLTVGGPNNAFYRVHTSLGTGIRQVYSVLLRVTQLEQQLFESLFHVESELMKIIAQVDTTTPSGASSPQKSIHGRENEHNTGRGANAEDGNSRDTDQSKPGNALMGSFSEALIVAVQTILQTHASALAENGGGAISSYLAAAASSRSVLASVGSAPLGAVNGDSSSAAGSAVGAAFLQDSPELLGIVENVSNATRDFLRPLIINEASVDELCRVVSTLAEDVKSQMLAMPVPKLLLKLLLHGLDGTVCDAKERLSYCAEVRLRQDVQMFEPRPSHLAYPDILEAFYGDNQANAEESALTATSTTAAATVAPGGVAHPPTTVYETWYPPMRHTLSLLSKLYGVVEMTVFEDFARRSVELCVQALRAGSEGVKKNRPMLHGDLFLVRHLLILREQLVPFEIRLQGVERNLDFSSTSLAFSHFLQNSQSLLRFDYATNGLLQFAISGLPNMHETQTDAKRDLDMVLKAACYSLKQSALKMLLGALDGLLAKVAAFAGEIPVAQSSPSHASSNNKGKDQDEGDSSFVNFSGNGSSGVLANDGQPLLSPEARASLKNQAFLRPERVKELLEGVQQAIVQHAPDLKIVMELYIDNSAARNILLKPILQEFSLSIKKMECVVASCLDPGQGKRDIEALLRSLAYTVSTELSNEKA